MLNVSLKPLAMTSLIASLSWMLPACGGDETSAATEALEPAAHETQELCTPSISDVDWNYPVNPSIKEHFYIYGSCLPQTIAFWIDQCAAVTLENFNTNFVVYSCTPNWSTGWKSGVIKSYSGGPLLWQFSVYVE